MIGLCGCGKVAKYSLEGGKVLSCNKYARCQPIDEDTPEAQGVTCKYKSSPGCITVAELKQFLKNLPEVNEHGEPFEVWVGGEGNNSTNGAISLSPLCRTPHGSDILISSK